MMTLLCVQLMDVGYIYFIYLIVPVLCIDPVQSHNHCCILMCYAIVHTAIRMQVCCDVVGCDVVCCCHGVCWSVTLRHSGCVPCLPHTCSCSNEPVEYTRLPTSEPKSESTSDQEEEGQGEDKGGQKWASQQDEEMLNPIVQLDRTHSLLVVSIVTCCLLHV